MSEKTVTIVCPVCKTTYTAKVEAETTQPSPWHFPVLPPAAWYAASLHDETGVKNGGYRHTGIDLNLDRPPWGDVDYGQTVYAVHDGIIFRMGFHEKYRGGVIVFGEHEGIPLYTRYWHLQKEMTFPGEGSRVKAGDVIGHLDHYANAGDHLHFDMALDPFELHWWFSNHQDVRFVDPVPILKAHLTPSEVDLMLGKGDD